MFVTLCTTFWSLSSLYLRLFSGTYLSHPAITGSKLRPEGIRACDSFGQHPRCNLKDRGLSGQDIRRINGVVMAGFHCNRSKILGISPPQRLPWEKERAGEKDQYSYERTEIQSTDSFLSPAPNEDVVQVD